MSPARKPAAGRPPGGAESANARPAGEAAAAPAALEHALLAGLNEPQREAVTHFEGPLLVLAGAGSGKTRVLTHRVAYLIQAHGVRPDEILAITFTNKAAGEMKARVERPAWAAAPATMWISTFHACAPRLLRREAQRLGFNKQLHDPRRGRPPASHQALSRGARPRRQALSAGGAGPPDLATPRTS